MKKLAVQLINELTSLSDAIPVGFKGLFAKANGLYIKSSNDVEEKVITSINDTIRCSKVDVSGGIKISDDKDTASSNNVGTLRYRIDANSSHIDMCMQTSADTYSWVNIKRNSW